MQARRDFRGEKEEAVIFFVFCGVRETSREREGMHMLTK